MAKSKYNENFPLLAEGYAREGMIDEEIAAKLGVSPDTFYQYQKRYPEFAKAIKRGKVPVDVKVEKALLKRALGYEYEEVKVEFEAVPDGGEAKAKSVTKTKKQVAPEVTAQIFWLTNRRPDLWKHKRSMSISADSRLPLELILTTDAKPISEPKGDLKLEAAEKDDKALAAPGRGAKKP